MRYSRCIQLTIGLLCFVGAACQNPNEKLAAEKYEAAVEISKAEQKVEKVRDEAREKIVDAQTQGAIEVEEAKIEATEEIAEAKREVAEEKIEATEEIVDAEQKAETDPDPQLP